MYKIAICEDNSDDVTYLKKMIETVHVVDKNRSEERRVGKEC